MADRQGPMKTKGQAAKDLADAIIDALDDNETKIMEMFARAGLPWTSFTGAAVERLTQMIRRSPLESLRQFVDETAQEQPDHATRLASLLREFESVTQLAANGGGRPVQEQPEPKFSGKCRNEFNRRLLEEWTDLANIFEIPDHERATWGKGREADEIWKWLASRKRLRELPEALADIGRQDLADLLNADAERNS